ncbi:MAG: hypothetical protein PHE50_08625, partial [Dehalococcoidales bacterium]|nr:hypothetical protein [Dehalococcoidales bacterium]
SIIRDEAGKVRYHFINVDYLAEYVSGTARAQSDAADMNWVTKDEMTALDMNPRLRDIIMTEMGKNTG